jgi:hypothetical protein
MMPSVCFAVTTNVTFVAAAAAAFSLPCCVCHYTWLNSLSAVNTTSAFHAAATKHAIP